MNKVIIFAIIGLVFVSGCVGNDLKADVDIDAEGITIDPDPITIKTETVIDTGVNYIKGLFDFSEEEIVNESVAEQTDD